MSDIDNLNEVARNVAEEMHRKFPELPIESVRFGARFVAVAAEAIKATEAELAKSGKTLSQKGYEYVFDRAAEMARID